MKATALLMAVACVALVSGQSQPEPLKQTAPVSVATQVAFSSSILRGFIQGYRKGMYRDANYKVTDFCFDSETQGLIVDVSNTIGSPTADWAQIAVNTGRFI